MHAVVRKDTCSALQRIVRASLVGLFCRFGTYTYAGTGYANPDAVTSIGATSLAYDTAGNDTSSGSSSFTWDWRNRLNMSLIAATSSTYSYDENDKRVRVNDGLTDIEENESTFTIDWKGRYRIEGDAFVYMDRETGRLVTIHGYPTHKLIQKG
jgi:hypothetical protein